MKSLILIFSFLCISLSSHADATITISSKPFTESRLLGEMLAQIIEAKTDLKVDRKLGMGQMAMLIEGMKADEIDFYVDYTGTLAHALLKKPSLVKISDIRSEMLKFNMNISDSLGFNNTYAVAMLEELAASRGIEKISDLKSHKDLKAGFNSDFIKRDDGYPKLQKVYGLGFESVSGITHGLKVQALTSKEIDLSELYATDSKLAKYPLRVLEDDKSAFPAYYAVIVANQKTINKYPKLWSELKSLEGIIARETMTGLNALVEIDGKKEAEVVADFLKNTKQEMVGETKLFLQRSLEHLFLVFVPLMFAIFLGIPMGLASFYNQRLGSVLIGFASTVQTIPSIALLCLLIPIVGIGAIPAYIALFLYALLPIVQGTYVGLQSIDTKLIESAKTLGLSKAQQIKEILLPLASRSILGGVKTSAIINVGTATIAAFIGAGGYGEPIVTGLNLYDIPMILSGAVPAALMAVVLHLLFYGVERILVSPGLR